VSRWSRSRRLSIRAETPRRHYASEDAADILAALSSDRMYASLRDMGWSFDRSESWIAATVKGLLLGDQRPTRTTVTE
jgi:hypothetical protein